MRKKKAPAALGPAQKKRSVDIFSKYFSVIGHLTDRPTVFKPQPRGTKTGTHVGGTPPILVPASPGLIADPRQSPLT